MEPNSSRKSWLSLVRITISLFTKPLTGIGGCSSKAGRGKGWRGRKDGRKREVKREKEKWREKGNKKGEKREENGREETK